MKNNSTPLLHNYRPKREGFIKPTNKYLLKEPVNCGTVVEGYHTKGNSLVAVVNERGQIVKGFVNAT